MFGASIGLMPIISKPSFFISTLDFNNMLTDLGVYFRFAHFKIVLVNKIAFQIYELENLSCAYCKHID